MYAGPGTVFLVGYGAKPHGFIVPDLVPVSGSWILFLVPELVSGSGSGSWFWIRFQVPLYCSTNVSQVIEIEICFCVKLAKLRYIF